MMPYLLFYILLVACHYLKSQSLLFLQIVKQRLVRQLSHNIHTKVQRGIQMCIRDSCISVDPWFLVGDYPSLAKVIDESMRTNDGMPDFVLNRIYEIMKEKGMIDTNRVGLYGLTYKENVDDMRESPTLQLLESQERHLATGLKVYDPFITKEVVSNQYYDLDSFLENIDMVVIMVKHDEIKENLNKLSNKVVLDCHNIIKLPGVYHI